MIKEIVKYNDSEIEIRKPSNKLIQSAQMAYNVKLASLIKASAISKDDSLLSRSQLDRYLKDIGIWTNEDQMNVFKLQTDVIALSAKLNAGGIKLIEAKVIAIDLKIKRQNFDY